MRNERRILLNTMALSATEGVGQLANFILVVSFARAFGAGVMGYYSVGMAVGAVAALFVSLGTQSLLVREFSRDATFAPTWLGVLFPVQVLLAFVAWIVACVVSVVLAGNANATFVVMGVCGYQVLLRLASLLLTPLQAKELMLISSAGDVTHRVLVLVLGIVAIQLGASAALVALMLVVSGAGFLVFAWIQSSRRFGRPALQFSPAEAVKLFRRAAPFFGIAALAVIYARGAIIMLSVLSSAHAVGIYAVADRLMVAVGLGPNVFNSAVYPALARVAATSVEEAKALCSRCLRILLVIAVPCATLATVFAADIVSAFFGASYLGAAAVLQVLAWTLPIRGAQALLGSQLSAMDQQNALARARLIGLCVFAVLAPLLILGLGYVGAAWALLGCDSIQLGLYFWLLYKVQAAPAVIPAFLRPGIAAAASLGAGLMLTGAGFGVRLAIVTGVMVVAMWGCGAVKAHDVRFLMALVSGKASRFR